MANWIALSCPNDECRGIELMPCRACEGLKGFDDDGNPAEYGLPHVEACEDCKGTGTLIVLRVGWEAREIPATRVDPGYVDDHGCPRCGSDGQDADEQYQIDGPRLAMPFDVQQHRAVEIASRTPATSARRAAGGI
jgi:DnaJ-class molecular chaperone